MKIPLSSFNIFIQEILIEIDEILVLNFNCKDKQNFNTKTAINSNCYIY